MTTDNNPPAEVTTPPDGYEWTGEWRVPDRGEPYAVWSNNKHWYVDPSLSAHPRPILRKLKPQTVDLIGVPIEAARELVNWWTHSQFTWGRTASEIARKAIEKWEQPDA